MSDETIVAVYDTPAHAALAAADLRQANVPDDAITLHAATGKAASVGTEPVREQGFWASLFGGEPDHDTTVYDRSLADGSTVLTVKAPGEHVAAVTRILESHGPIDIDDRAHGYGLTQTATTTTTRAPLAAPVASATVTPGATVADGATMQLAEERLSVGKRVVNRGGTRIRRFVVETPVEENVTLHSEKVMLDRRPVTDGRVVTDADFTDKTIEMTETSEEAIVAKTAHVVEEIGLRKVATDRVETVRDTLRKEEVEIVETPAETVPTGTRIDPRTPKV